MIVVPSYLLFFDDDDDPQGSELVEAAADPNKAAKVLTESSADTKQGIRVNFPSDWTGKVVNRVVRVTSDESETAIAVFSRGGAVDAPGVFKQAVNGFRESLTSPKVTLVPGKQAKPIAGLPSAQAVIVGRDKGGVARRTFVAVARGKKRSYVITVVTPENGGEVVAANLILARGLTLSG